MADLIQSEPPAPPLPPKDGAATLSDILDVPALQAMMDAFFALERIGMAIIDLHGRVLVATGWQDVCTKFHRVHPETCKHCIESDVALSGGIAPGEFKLYRCQNNLWDMATPIVVGGRHVGNFFLGQFFFDDEQPDMDFFRAQARRYGFDEADYLAALDRVPRWSRKKVEQAMTFYARLATQISEMGYRNLQLTQALADQKLAEEDLRDSKQIIEGIIHAIPARVFWKNRNLTYLGCNEAFARDAGFASPQDVIGKDDFQMGWREQAELYRRDDRRVIESGRPTLLIEEPQTTPDGKTLALLTSKMPLRNAKGEIAGVLGTYLDVTDRKQAEEKLRESERQLKLLFGSMSSGFALHEIILDEAGRPCDYRFLQVNPAFEALTGLKADALIGRTVLEVLPGTESTWIERYGRVALTGEPATFENYSRELKRHYQVTAYCPQPGQFAVLVGDITDRKQAEAALRDSDALHHSILNASPDDITLADLDGRILMASRAALKMFGLQRENQLIGRPVADFLVPEDRERAAADIARMFQGVFSGPGEYRALRNDGTHFDIEVNGEFIRDETGHPFRMVLIVRDVTARKQTEQALQESEQRHRDYLAHSPYGIFVADEKGRLVQVNPTAGRLTGYSEKELLSMTVPDLHGEESREDAARHFQAVVHEGKAIGELKYRTKSGESRWWLVSAVKISDTRFLGFCNDVTDRKQAEEKLQASAERFRDLAANIPGAIYQLQTGRTGALEVPYMSSGCEALFGRPVSGMDFAGLLFDHMHVGDRALFEHSLAKAAQRLERWSLEFRVELPDGHTKWLRGAANPRSTPQGGVLWNGVLLDITKLKRAEQSLREREAFQNLLMDTIPSPVFYKDRQGRYLGFNKAFETLSGKTKSQLVGQNVFDVAPPELAKIYHAKDLELLEQPGTQVYEAPMQDAQGGRHDVVFHKATLLDAQGAVSGLIGILLDVTERKRAEQKILQESLLNKTIINSIPGTFYMLDETGNYLRWSTYQQEQIVGQPDEAMRLTSALSTIHPDDRALVQARIENVLKNGVDETVEGRVLLRGGPDFRWFLMTGRRMVVDGRPALIGIGIDVTERKRVEAEAVQQLDELRRWQTVTLGRENRVAELKREVNALSLRLGQPPPYPSAEEK